MQHLNWNNTFVKSPEALKKAGEALYSSAAFTLPGMIMAAKQNVTWDKMDQAVIFDRLSDADAAVYTSMKFPTTQMCSDLGDAVVDQYTIKNAFADGDAWLNDTFEMDSHNVQTGLNDISCGNNGWTMGNVILSPSQSVQFWVNLLQGKLLNQSSVDLMIGSDGKNDLYFDWGGYPEDTWPSYGAVNVTGFPDGIANAHMKYGLGVELGGSVPSLSNYTVFGHGGMGWGSRLNTRVIQELGAVYSIASNNDKGMGYNTSLSYLENEKMMGELTGALVNATLAHFSEDKDAITTHSAASN